MSTKNTPDQSEKANQAITEALFASTGVITHSTARLIAAALHSGHGSALERLAATGQFDPAILRRELDGLIVGPGHEPWRQALVLYVESVRQRTHPWARSATRNRTGGDARGEKGTSGPFA